MLRALLLSVTLLQLQSSNGSPPTRTDEAALSARSLIEEAKEFVQVYFRFLIFLLIIIIIILLLPETVLACIQRDIMWPFSHVSVLVS